jgi:hypothetical protein
MIFTSNPNEIEGTQGDLPALSLVAATIFSMAIRKTPMTSAPRPSGSSLKSLRDEASDCRACPLRKDATQTVFGEGPQHAQVMLVGEQPVTRRTWLANLLSDLPDKCSTVRWKRPASNGRKSMSPTR